MKKNIGWRSNINSIVLIIVEYSKIIVRFVVQAFLQFLHFYNIFLPSGTLVFKFFTPSLYSAVLNFHQLTSYSAFLQISPLCLYLPDLPLSSSICFSTHFVTHMSLPILPNLHYQLTFRSYHIQCFYLRNPF
jgi:hypothetical protein